MFLYTSRSYYSTIQCLTFTWCKKQTFCNASCTRAAVGISGMSLSCPNLRGVSNLWAMTTATIRKWIFKNANVKNTRNECQEVTRSASLTPSYVCLCPTNYAAEAGKQSDYFWWMNVYCETATGKMEMVNPRNGHLTLSNIRPAAWLHTRTANIQYQPKVPLPSGAQWPT